MVTGLVKNLKPSQKNRLEKLASKRIPSHKVITPETARQLCELSF
jgi:hypothetical protein